MFRRKTAVLLIVLIALSAVLWGCRGEPGPPGPPGLPGPQGSAAPTPAVTSEVQSQSLPLSFADMAERVIPGVVFIFAETDRRNAIGAPVTASGSGVILRSDGYILTNKHVVAGARRVEVTMHDRRVFQAVGTWQDDLLDLAVIKIETQELPSVPFADPERIRVGDPVIAFGHALGLSPFEGGLSVTSGIVSNLGRSLTVGGIGYYDLIQTDAAINPGNSGGPLVNLAGEVIGINSVESARAQGIGYAINVGTARHVFQDLVEFGRSLHPYLGVTAEDVTRDRAPVLACTCLAGAIVASVQQGSPAQAAGLQRNDIIVGLAGNEVASTADLIKFLWRLDIGSTVELDFFRVDTVHTVNVTLTERPPGATQAI